MLTPKWTHEDRQARNRKGRYHVVDPHYNGSGWMGGEQPSYWTCHTCGKKARLNGDAPPITVAAPKKRKTPESKMSQQP